MAHFCAWQYQKKLQERLRPKMEHASPKAFFWFGEEEEIHLFFYPHHFHSQNQKLGNEWLNLRLGKKNFSFYWLRLVHFDGSSIPFDSHKDWVALSLRDGRSITSLSLSLLEKDSNSSLKLWLRSLEHSTEILERTRQKPSDKETSGKWGKVIPIMPQYLIAFPTPVFLEEIQAVEVMWNGKNYKLQFQECSRKKWDEYLRNPDQTFWQ